VAFEPGKVLYLHPSERKEGFSRRAFRVSQAFRGQGKHKLFQFKLISDPSACRLPNSISLAVFWLCTDPREAFFPGQELTSIRSRFSRQIFDGCGPSDL
jgi:hypothetical protein